MLLTIRSRGNKARVSLQIGMHSGMRNEGPDFGSVKKRNWVVNFAFSIVLLSEVSKETMPQIKNKPSRRLQGCHNGEIFL